MEELFESKAYQELIQKNNYNTLEFLLKEGVDFGIVAYTQFINFNPEIPETVIQFDKYALFMIAGYSKESALLEKNSFSFEAGFGESNYGSLLTIPLEAIAQIIVGEDIVTLSHFEPKEKKEPKNSMDLLLNNPENQSLLKKLHRAKKD